ncbi:thiamine biosynthesis protein ThiF [Nonomuraea muscovyensis]|uniref:thiamine biosynthesis protein ThiF n=1 Tax=Nonomuraea muscovyensis TaxID=1124761 RepID=UPI0033CDB25F
MRPRVTPALRRILRDERTLQLGVHPARAVLLTGLTGSVRQWISGLDGSRDLRQVLRAASAAGLAESRATALLDGLTARGAVHDLAVTPATLPGLSLAERDRLEPDIDALDLASTGPAGGLAALRQRMHAKVRVYGAARVGAQIVTLLASCGVGEIRVIDPVPVRPRDLTPGGLTWQEIGLTREEAAATVARRLTSGDPPPFIPPTSTAPTSVGSPSTGPTSSGPTGSRRARSASTSSAGTPSTPAGVPSAPSDLAAPAHPSRPPQRGGPSASGVARAGVETGPSASPRRPGGARRAGPTVVPPAPPGTPSVKVIAGAPYLGDGTHRPDLVILAPAGPLDRVLVNELMELGIPHLLASAFEGHGSVGPLVLPGRTACLHCIDLTRRDGDPAWPVVTALLGGYPPGEIACDTTLATLVAATAAGHTLAYLDGHEPAVTNGTSDVMPDWRWRRSAWHPHPECRCMRNNR